MIYIQIVSIIDMINNNERISIMIDIIIGDIINTRYQRGNNRDNNKIINNTYWLRIIDIII